MAKMRPLGILGIGLSLVFGCLLLALVAEVYYLLWWKKKRIALRDIEGGHRKKTSDPNPQERRISSDDGQLKELDGEEGSIEAELMRLHSLSGPPRLLFTIKEETKEELESEDGSKSREGRSRKGSRGRSLSDFLLSPISSPPLTLTLTHLDCCYSQQHGGFNPLFESSPPPKLKFLKDAEEKLYRRTLMEEALRAAHKIGGACASAEDGAKPPSFVTHSPHLGWEQEQRPSTTSVIGKSTERVHQQQHLLHHSSASQITPLPSFPSSTRPE